MALREFAQRQQRKWARLLAKLRRTDEITGAKIASRDDLERIGSEYGGWVIPCKMIDQTSICYCAGCGEDITFDLELIDRFGCHVHGFDPTPRAVRYVDDVAGGNPNYHFHERGLWDHKDRLKFFAPRNSAHVSHSLVNLQQTEEYITVEVERLSHVMKQLRHDRLDLLKIDIEGAEYKVIESIVRDAVDIRVLCVEFDEFGQPLDREFRTRVRQSLTSLLGLGYGIVHADKRGNYTLVKQTSA